MSASLKVKLHPPKTADLVAICLNLVHLTINRTRRLNLLGFIVLICSSLDISAQCPPGDVLLTSQNQVDSFLIDYPTCDLISGRLAIGRQFNSGPFSDITDLSPLSNIQSVDGFFIVDGNPNLTSLFGLGGLSSAQGIIIQFNDDLTDLTALSNLDAPQLIITNNSTLPNLAGLQGITSTTSLTIADNPNITALSMPNMSQASQVFLRNLPSLTSLVDFGTFLDLQLLSVDNCDALTSLDGPPGMVQLAIIRLLNNDNLSSIHGYNFNLTHNSNGVEIINNPKLTSLGDFNANQVGLGQGLIVDNNPLLASVAPPVSYTHLTLPTTPYV